MPNAIQRLYPNANAGRANLGRVPLTGVRRADLVAEMIFGRDAATSITNSGTGSAGSIVGSPVFGDHFATVGPAAYIDTNVSDATYLSFILVAAPGDDPVSDVYFATGGFIGQLNFYNNNGIQFQATDSAGGTTGLNATAPAPSAPSTEYRALCGRIAGLANPTMKTAEYKGGVRVASTSYAGTATRVLAPQSLKIGSLGSAFGAPFNACALLVWSGGSALTDGQELAAYQDLRASLAPMGKAI